MKIHSIHGREFLQITDKNTAYIMGEMLKMRLNIMFALMFWSVVMFAFYLQNQIHSTKAVIRIDIENASLNLQLFPYVLAGLFAGAVVYTVLGYFKYQKISSQIDAVQRGSDLNVQMRPPFSYFGTILIYIAMVACTVIGALPTAIFTYSWSFNLWLLFSTGMAIFGFLYGLNCAVGSSMLMDWYKRQRNSK